MFTEVLYQQTQVINKIKSTTVRAIQERLKLMKKLYFFRQVAVQNLKEIINSHLKINLKMKKKNLREMKWLLVKQNKITRLVIQGRENHIIILIFVQYSGKPIPIHRTISIKTTIRSDINNKIQNQN